MNEQRFAATLLTLVFGMLLLGLMTANPVKGADWLDCFTPECVQHRFPLGTSKAAVREVFGSPMTGAINDETGETIEAFSIPGRDMREGVYVFYFDENGKVTAIDHGAPKRTE